MKKEQGPVPQHPMQCGGLELPGVELTSLFGAEAGDRTGPLGALWGKGRHCSGEFIISGGHVGTYSMPPANSHWNRKNSLSQEP